MAKYIHRRNFKFKKDVALANKSQMLGVGIDPSKHFHRVVIFDFAGKVLMEPFSMDTFKNGYSELKRNIAKCAKKIKATEIYIGIEGASSYSLNLIRHLNDEFDNVVHVAPNTVAANREQRLLAGLKTDDIDAGAVGDLLIRGEFKRHFADRGIYFRLKELVYWREKKMILLVAAKNQVLQRIEKIYPSINITYGDQKKLFSNPDEDVLFNGLIRYGKTGREILNTPTQVMLKAFNYKYTKSSKRVEMLKEKFREMLLPDESIAKEQLRMLERDVNFMFYLREQVQSVESEIVELAKQTPAKYIMGQIKGITDIQAGMYIGLIGDIRQYRDASDVFAKSGLCPKIQQSGMKQKTRYGIRRTGSKLLRTHLFRMATFALLSEPVFKDYFNRKKEAGDKHWKKIRIAVINKLNRVLFALIRDRSDFDPNKTKPLAKL